MYKYKAKEIDKYWFVIASGEGSEELKVARIPNHIKKPEVMAKTIAWALNGSASGLTNLI